MTAEPIEDVWLSTRGRDWTWADLQEIPVPAYWRVELDGPDAPLVVVHVLEGAVCREVRTVRAGESVVVDTPFPVELRPAELVGPSRRD